MGPNSQSAAIGGGGGGLGLFGYVLAVPLSYSTGRGRGGERERKKENKKKCGKFESGEERGGGRIPSRDPIWHNCVRNAAASSYSRGWIAGETPPPIIPHEVHTQPEYKSSLPCRTCANFPPETPEVQLLSERLLYAPSIHLQSSSARSVIPFPFSSLVVEPLLLLSLSSIPSLPPNWTEDDEVEGGGRTRRRRLLIIIIMLI